MIIEQIDERMSNTINVIILNSDIGLSDVLVKISSLNI